MEEKKDILEGMKNAGMPFRVPEGYFEEMPDRMAAARREEVPVSFARKAAPYMAFAASLLLIVTGGTYFLRHVTPDRYDDESLYTSNITSEMTEDDVLAYMIYTRAEIEEFVDYLDE